MTQLLLSVTVLFQQTPHQNTKDLTKSKWTRHSVKLLLAILI